MDNPYQEKTTYCNFPGTNGVQYRCFQNEICCKEGCCQRPPYMIFKIWYLWIVLLAIFFFCSGGVRCCKLLRKKQSSPRRSSARRNTTPETLRPDFTRINNGESLWRYLDGLGEEDAIERYLACREAKNCAHNRNREASPPPYDSLRKSATVLEISEPPPQYNTICNNNKIKTEEIVEVHKDCAKSKNEIVASKTTTQNEQPKDLVGNNDAAVIYVGVDEPKRMKSRRAEDKDG